MPSALDSFIPPGPSAHRHEVLGRELTAYPSPFREVVRASVDGFHRPRVQRYARGRSPEAYYRDSYDYASLSAGLVEPFRAGRPFVTAGL